MFAAAGGGAAGNKTLTDALLRNAHDQMPAGAPNSAASAAPAAAPPPSVIAVAVGGPVGATAVVAKFAAPAMDREGTGSPVVLANQKITNKAARLFFSKYLAEKLGVDKATAKSLEINFIRDWPWGSLSQVDFNQFFRATSATDEWGQYFGQQIYPTIAMSLYVIGVAVEMSCADHLTAEEKCEEICDAVISCCAAAAAIGPWDGCQYLGLNIDACIPACVDKTSVLALNCWAGIFPGLGEGPTQMIVGKIGALLKSPEERNKFMQDPLKYMGDNFRRFAFEFGVSITIGHFPGNVWQLVYAVGLAASLHPALTGFLIAVAVCASNYAYSKVLPKIMELYDKSGCAKIEGAAATAAPAMRQPTPHAVPGVIRAVDAAASGAINVPVRAGTAAAGADAVVGSLPAPGSYRLRKMRTGAAAALMQATNAVAFAGAAASDSKDGTGKPKAAASMALVPTGSAPASYQSMALRKQ